MPEWLAGTRHRPLVQFPSFPGKQGAGKLTLPEEAHGHAEVVLPEEHDVDAVNGGDLLHVVDAGLGLHLHGDDDVVVVGARVAQETRLVGAALREVDGARAVGRAARERVFAARHGLPELGGGVDVRDQDAVGAEVEGLLDAGAVVVSRDADHRLGAAVGDRPEHARESDRLHRAVLGVDEQPVIAGAGELLGNGGADGVDEDAKLGVAGLELRLRASASESAARAGAIAGRQVRGLLGAGVAMEREGPGTHLELSAGLGRRAGGLAGCVPLHRDDRRVSTNPPGAYRSFSLALA